MPALAGPRSSRAGERSPAPPAATTGGSLTRRTLAVTAGAAALVALAALAWGRLRRAPQTDEDLIVALFEGAARAVEARDVSAAVEGVSERFAAEGLDRHGVKQVLAFQVLRGGWVSVSIAGARVRVDGDQARANVDAVLSRGARGKDLAALLPAEASAHRFSFRLAREPEGWRVVEASWRPVELAEALAGPPEPEP